MEDKNLLKFKFWQKAFSNNKERDKNLCNTCVECRDCGCDDEVTVSIAGKN